MLFAPRDEKNRRFVSYGVSQSFDCAQDKSTRGLPIGNLTSQIFANIYLNEFDQFVLHSLKPLGYVRYGDDFVLWMADELTAKAAQTVGTQLLTDELRLSVNPRHDRVQPAWHKLAYLGVDIWPTGHRLQRRTQHKIQQKVTPANLASYQNLVHQHMPTRYHKRFLWRSIDFLDEIW